MLKDVLEGKPFRHPVHSFLVHFPVGLFILSLVLDLASLVFSPAPSLVQGAFYSMSAGLVLALVAAVPGFVDFTDIRADHPAKKVAIAHMILNLLAVGVYGVNIGVRTGSLANAQVPITPLILSFVAIGILSVSGYLGGMMVYDDGIAVGRHRRRTATPQHTLHRSAANLKAEPGSELIFIEVARDAALHNGETLRVEIDGQTMVLAKWEDTVYAFQEFCTHRFGPLSEGAIKNGQVECPWHRSCFELRTGRVVQGPAKVELKTFKTEIRNGNICVGLPGPQEQRLAA